jgi:hypothetical protein
VVLDAADFQLLIERDSQIAERVHELVRQRVDLKRRRLAATSPPGN